MQQLFGTPENLGLIDRSDVARGSCISAAGRHAAPCSCSPDDIDMSGCGCHLNVRYTCCDIETVQHSRHTFTASTYGAWTGTRELRCEAEIPVSYAQPVAVNEPLA